MKDEQLDDLKQFIDSKISQAEERITTEVKDDIDGVESRLVEKIDELRNEMHDGFTGVAEAVEEINSQATQLDVRVSTLEQKAV